MEVYWILAIFTVLLNTFSVKEENHYSVRLLVSLVPLFLYGAFRVDFGLDYNEYEDFFDGVKIYGIEADDRMESGYYYLNKILPTFRSLLIFQSLLLCTAFYFLFKWYVPAKWAWFVFLLLFLNGPQTIFFLLSGIRNGIAISIFIISSYFIYKRKFLPFAVMIFIAYWFHKSVILYAPIAYFIANEKALTKRNFMIWLSVMIVLAAASFTIILDYLEIFINTYFERYMDYVELAKEEEKGAGALVLIFSFLASGLFFLFVKGRNLTTKENVVIKLTIFFYLAFLLGPLNFRMSQYFVLFFLASTVIVLRNSSRKFLKYSYIVTVLAYTIYAFIIWISNPYFSYDTYDSVLF